MSSSLLCPPLPAFRLLAVLIACAFVAACDSNENASENEDNNGECRPLVASDCPASICGLLSDGCGGILDCGGCAEGLSCGGGGEPNICGEGACLPMTCAALGVSCGTVSDGCGGQLNCGECNVCNPCEPGRCGSWDDGCGGTADCGACAAPDSCQSDGYCACTPLTCADLGNPNGEAYDGCGQFIQCAGSGESTERVRILAGNLSSTGTMTLSNGSTEELSETWDPGPGKRILRGLKPQVALLQEFKTLFYEKDRTGYWRNSDAALRDFVRENFGDRFYAYREDRTGRNMGKPNGIVSYFPIKEAGEFPSALENIQDRQHVWARIDIPGDRDLWVVSVHLATGSNASDFGTTQTAMRRDEMDGLIADLKTLNIPSGDFLVIGGDFNIGTRGESCMNALDSSGLVYVDSESDCPIDQDGNGDTNANRNEPYDGILANTRLKNHQTKVAIDGASNLSKRGLVFDSRDFYPLSAVSPVQRSDSDADSMQHMAVIKDFAVPR